MGLYSDFIVGFPGETEADFDETVQLVKKAQFDGIFVFKYSPREGTSAFSLKETLTEAQKVRRIQILSQIQDEITLKRNQQLIESVQTILAEGQSKKSKPNQYMGRTDSNKIVVFKGDDSMIGSLINVRIVAAEGRTLFGEIIE